MEVSNATETAAVECVAVTPEVSNTESASSCHSISNNFSCISSLENLLERNAPDEAESNLSDWEQIGETSSIVSEEATESNILNNFENFDLATISVLSCNDANTPREISAERQKTETAVDVLEKELPQDVSAASLKPVNVYSQRKGALEFAQEHQEASRLTSHSPQNRFQNTSALVVDRFDVSYEAVPSFDLNDCEENFGPSLPANSEGRCQDNFTDEFNGHAEGETTVDAVSAEKTFEPSCAGEYIKSDYTPVALEDPCQNCLITLAELNSLREEIRDLKRQINWNASSSVQQHPLSNTSVHESTAKAINTTLQWMTKAFQHITDFVFGSFDEEALKISSRAVSLSEAEALSYPQLNGVRASEQYQFYLNNLYELECSHDGRFKEFFPETLASEPNFCSHLYWQSFLKNSVDHKWPDADVLRVMESLQRTLRNGSGKNVAVTSMIDLGPNTNKHSSNSDTVGIKQLENAARWNHKYPPFKLPYCTFKSKNTVGSFYFGQKYPVALSPALDKNLPTSISATKSEVLVDAGTAQVVSSESHIESSDISDGLKQETNSVTNEITISCDESLMNVEEKGWKHSLLFPVKKWTRAKEFVERMSNSISNPNKKKAAQRILFPSMLRQYSHKHRTAQFSDRNSRVTDLPSNQISEMSGYKTGAAAPLPEDLSKLHALQAEINLKGNFVQPFSVEIPYFPFPINPVSELQYLLRNIFTKVTTEVSISLNKLCSANPALPLGERTMQHDGMSYYIPDSSVNGRQRLLLNGLDGLNLSNTINPHSAQYDKQASALFQSIGYCESLSARKDIFNAVPSHSQSLLFETIVNCKNAPINSSEATCSRQQHDALIFLYGKLEEEEKMEPIYLHEFQNNCALPLNTSNGQLCHVLELKMESKAEDEK